MLQRCGRTAGLIEPCLPSPAKVPPSGPDWLHEIKHDGFRLMAQRSAKGVRLYTFIPATATISLSASPGCGGPGDVASSSCLIDGEAIVSNESGLAVFELIVPSVPGSTGSAARGRGRLEQEQAQVDTRSHRKITGCPASTSTSPRRTKPPPRREIDSPQGLSPFLRF